MGKTTSSGLGDLGIWLDVVMTFTFPNNDKPPVLRRRPKLIAGKNFVL